MLLPELDHRESSPSNLDSSQVHTRKRSIPDVPVDIEFYLEEMDTSMERRTYSPGSLQYPQFRDPFISESRRGSWTDSPSTSDSSGSPRMEARGLENEPPLNKGDWELPLDDCLSSQAPSPATSTVISQFDALAPNGRYPGRMYSELEIETKPVSGSCTMLGPRS